MYDRGGQIRADKSKGEQSGAEQSSAEHNRVVQSSAEQCKEVQSSAEQSCAEHKTLTKIYISGLQILHKKDRKKYRASPLVV